MRAAAGLAGARASRFGAGLLLAEELFWARLAACFRVECFAAVPRLRDLANPGAAAAGTAARDGEPRPNEAFACVDGGCRASAGATAAVTRTTRPAASLLPPRILRRPLDAPRARPPQLRNTMQLPPADFKFEQSFSAASRVSAPTRIRVQTAEPRPAILRWITTGGRPPRTAGYCFCKESKLARAPASDQLPASCTPQGGGLGCAAITGFDGVNNRATCGHGTAGSTGASRGSPARHVSAEWPVMAST